MTEEDDKLDLSEWPVDEPPADFAENVMRATREDAGREDAVGDASSGDANRGGVHRPVVVGIASRRAARWGAAAVLAVAAAAALYVRSQGDTHGEITADESRREVKLGNRAVAVLEPGASVKWNGALVEQARGNVFYRVERGDGFRVHTASGDVDVSGTCFRVDLKANGDEMNKRDLKVGLAGAAITSLLMVSVYEGKVAVSHAQESVSVGAGQSAVVSGTGVSLSSAGFSGTGAAGGAGTESALENANTNLVGTVSDYRRRLETIEGQKKELESKLAVAEAKARNETRGGEGGAARNEFDLSHDDLVALAKEGTLKYMRPCSKADYRPDADALQKLALAPQDADTIAAAYKKLSQWREAQMRPLCIEALGRSELTERMSLDACVHLVSDFLSETNPKARRDAQQLAVDIRAGLTPMPGPNEKLPPLTGLMLDSTKQIQILEDELARTFGPDEAHRIAYTPDGLCMGQSTWGGPKK
jgi:hypothetical protein